MLDLSVQPMSAEVDTVKANLKVLNKHKNIDWEAIENKDEDGDWDLCMDFECALKMFRYQVVL